MTEFNGSEQVALRIRREKLRKLVKAAAKIGGLSDVCDKLNSEIVNIGADLFDLRHREGKE